MTIRGCNDVSIQNSLPQSSKLALSLISTLLFLTVVGSAQAGYLNIEKQQGGKIENSDNRNDTKGDFILNSDAKSHTEFSYASVRGGVNASSGIFMAS